MAKLIKNGHTVTTTYAPEIVSLRAQGYVDVPDAFDAGVVVPAGISEVANNTGRAETVKPAAKSSK